MTVTALHLTRAVGAALCAVAVAGLATTAAAAQSAGDAVSADSAFAQVLIDVQVSPTGTARAEEVWTVPAGSQVTRHLIRYSPADLATRDDSDAATSYWDRQLSSVRVDGEPGVTVERLRAQPRPGREADVLTIDTPEGSGESTFVITYRAEQAAVTFGNQSIVHIPVLGGRDDMPPADVRVLIDGEGLLDVGQTCLTGTELVPRTCNASAVSGDGAVYREPLVHAADVLQVTARFDAAIVRAPVPTLVARQDSLTYALWGREWVLPTAAGISSAALLGFVLVIRASRRGRRAAQALAGRDALRSLPAGTDALPTRLERVSPGEIRPAEIGVLIEGVASARDVVATLVDLASRGFLRIRETTGLDPDWAIEWTGADSVAGLLPYELTLVDALGIVSADNEVSMETIRGTFALRLQRVQEAMLDHAVAMQWATPRPEALRRNWIFGGAVAAVAGLVLTPVAATAGTALLPLALALGGLCALAAAPYTANGRQAGHDIVDRAHGHRAYLVGLDPIALPSVEAQRLVDGYLGYTLMYGINHEVLPRLVGIHAVSPPQWWIGAGSIDRFVHAFGQFEAVMLRDIGYIPPRRFRDV